MRSGQRLDLGMYVRALPMLVRHPSIMVMPLLAAVVDLLVSSVSPLVNDPLGGLTQGIFQFFVQIIYGFAFGVAVIQASDIWRGRRGTFDDAWEEGRRKAGGIIMATIGFYFLLYVSAYIGGFLGAVQIALEIVAAFFLIYTIPAAAIGGLPGGLAISGSFRAARANIPATIVLAIVFFLLWVELPQVIVLYAGLHLTPILFELVIAVIRAIVLGYLAFPFAKQYDDIAFRGL